ncbi:MAG: hypothetical protein K8I27_00010 [Planctomycetes bacterium]|nr:hypothetical protein [Planctomycetota bacterium]
MSELEYLIVPNRYAQSLGGLDWSPTFDAIVDADGNTVVLTPALAQFMEDAGARDGPVHFAFVLHFVRRLTRGDGRLHRIWNTGANSIRNAGALFASLTATLPRVPGRIDVRKLCALLRRQTPLGELQFLPRGPVSPPLEPDRFSAHLDAALEALTDADLAHWLRHGRGPLPNQESPPPDLPPPSPRAPGDAFVDALKRKRLAGVAPFIDQMISALTLPPRHVMYSELPVGGYSSVTNRGHPDQILPGEFAVDEPEFLRRYAENELLYWQREEPQSRVRDDMIVLCDQGVRTWGEVRLALTAAAIAFGRRAEQHGRMLRYATTGNGGAPVADGRPALLEVSDLTPNPGLALERVLDEPGYEFRDVVLLTHPRNLHEQDVRAAARRLTPNVRLFALTVDELGYAELCQLRHGQQVPVRSFQLLQPDSPRPPVTESSRRSPWTGEVEPIAYPFRFGVVSAIRHLALDPQGRYLFAVSEGGLLHLWEPAADYGEILPRPLRSGRLAGEPVAIAGVRGGLACCYRDNHALLVAHYDLAARRAVIHTIRSDVTLFPDSPALSYLDDCHCVCVTTPDGKGGHEVLALDLDTGEVAPPPARGRRVDEAAKAALQAAGRPLPPSVEVVHQPPADLQRLRGAGVCSVLAHVPKEGRIGLLTETGLWKSWVPRADGGALLKDARVIEAVHAGGTLLMRTERERHERVLIYRGPEWRFLGEYNAQAGVRGLAVSADGARVAFRNKTAGAVCFELGDTAERLLTVSAGRSHSLVEVETGDSWFTVYGGKFTHLVRWDRERLEVAFLQGRHAIEDFIRRKREASALNPRKVHLRPGQVSPCKYDPARFQRYAYSPGGLLFVSDKHGQVAIFDAAENLVAMFYVFRGTVAASLPDGTRYGPASITGGPTSPDALGRVGQALKLATVGRRR